jgi:hypothetical protein
MVVWNVTSRALKKDHSPSEEEGKGSEKLRCRLLCHLLLEEESHPLKKAMCEQRTKIAQKL